MLDKLEPPVIPDGYGISIAYACLLEIIRSLQITIGPKQELDGQVIPPKESDKALHCQLIQSSWCGLLTALSQLVEASTDESITENILKSMQTYAALCGSLELHTPRDAFITSICKASLPPHYALTVLNTATKGTNIRGKNRPFVIFEEYAILLCIQERFKYIFAVLQMIRENIIIFTHKKYKFEIHIW